MARSASFISHLYKQEMDIVVHVLLRIYEKGSNGSNDVRLVNNTEKVSYKTHDYLAFPFDITLNHEDEQGPGTVNLTVANLDRTLSNTLLALEEAPLVDIMIITNKTGTNDDPEFELPPLRLLNATITRDTLTGEFSQHNFVSKSYPPVEFTPHGFPGLFK